MRRTTSRPVSVATLALRGSSAATVVALMMACNDLSLANEALGHWKKKRRSDRQASAKLYFLKLQLSHLFEALAIVEKINVDPALLQVVSRCDRQTQASFRRLQDLIPGGKDRPRLEPWFAQIRNNLAFHYGQAEKMIVRALQDRASRPNLGTSWITRGNTAYLWHFNLGDEVHDSIVVRQILKIPPSANVREEADKIAMELHQVFLTFMDFAGDFIWKYCGR
jgi:hypothetical protein